MLEGDSKTQVRGLEWKLKVDNISYKIKIDLTNVKKEKKTRPRLTKELF